MSASAVDASDPRKFARTTRAHAAQKVSTMAKLHDDNANCLGRALQHEQFDEKSPKIRQQGADLVGAPSQDERAVALAAVRQRRAVARQAARGMLANIRPCDLVLRMGDNARAPIDHFHSDGEWAQTETLNASLLSSAETLPSSPLSDGTSDSSSDRPNEPSDLDGPVPDVTISVPKKQRANLTTRKKIRDERMSDHFGLKVEADVLRAQMKSLQQKHHAEIMHALHLEEEVHSLRAELSRMTATCHEMLRDLLKTRMNDSCSSSMKCPSTEHFTDPVLMAEEDILNEHEKAFTEHLTFFSCRTVVQAAQDSSVSGSYCLSPLGSRIDSRTCDGSLDVVFKTSQELVNFAHAHAHALCL